MTVDSVAITETNYDPSGDWSPSWQGEFYGEAHDRGSDIPGTTGDQTTIDLIQKYDAGGNINFFETINGKTTSGTRYHRDVYDSSLGGNGVKVWTDPL